MSVSGMALKIRESTESDTFDLAGAKVATIRANVSAAFAEPFPISHMVRITFLTGGGKLCRSKYDDGAAGAIAASLREHGFEEDHGASCVPECAGLYKAQHDTGKNLRTMVVFPRIMESTGDSGGGDDDNAPSKPILELNSPDYMLAVAGFTTTFPRMVASKCSSWSQKRNAASSLEATNSQLKDMTEKLYSGTPLEDNEQEFFDATSTEDLERKLAYIRKEMGTQLEAGNVTFGERRILLEQVTERMQTIEANIKEATDENKPVKVKKLREALSKVRARKKTANSITPKGVTVPLRHREKIDALRMEARPLNALEASGKGRLMSLKETQAIGRRDEIMEKIEELYEASRGWFEEDEEFRKRVEESRRECDSREKAAAKRNTAKAKGKSTPATKSAGSSWATAGAPAKKYTAPSAPISLGKIGAGRATKKKPAGASGLFAAMMDSDSDSD